METNPEIKQASVATKLLVGAAFAFTGITLLIVGGSLLFGDSSITYPKK